MSDADPSGGWEAAAAAERRLNPEETWAPQSPPTPVELARELYQKRGVESATPQDDTIEIVLASRFETVPSFIARPIYRRGLAIADVSPVAGRQHLQLTVTAPEGR